MSISHSSMSTLFEVCVMLFQTCGVASLCVSRLAPRSSIWACWGRRAFIAALVGLGVSGALCGNNDSEFALFAGATMTLLLIGMTVGNGTTDATDVLIPLAETASA